MLPRKGRQLALYLTISWTISVASDSSVFLTSPKTQPYYVREGEEGPILDCSFAAEYLNRSRYEASWTAVSRYLPRYVTRNNLSFMKSHYELLQNDARYSLRIKTVDYQLDNGKFFCSVLDKETGKQLFAEANVVVVVAPDKPIISRQPSGAVRENELVTIECQSSSGNPPPTFTWSFSNNTLVPSDWHHEKPADDQSGASTSLLQWRVAAYDNEAYLICKIWNEALPKGEHKEISTNRLNVLYGPRVQAGPVQEYNAEEGERVELTCTADGNPSPSQYEWYHVATGERFPSSTWTFVAEKRHSGDFRCTAFNSVESGADKLNLNVLYGPVVKVKEMLNPAEGDTVVLECAVDANPAADSVVWTGPNGVTHNGPSLTFDAVTRLHSGNYTCTATNTLTVYSAKSGSVVRTGQATTVIDVLRRPGHGIVTGSHSAIVVGGQSKLTCTATDLGSPEAEFRWATPASGGSYSTGEQGSGTLVVERASLTDNGEYRCLPYNRIGDGTEGVFVLQVIEPSKISRPLPDVRVFVEGETGVSLSCETQGYPTPTVRWMKEKKEIGQSDDSHWQIHSEERDSSCPQGSYCSSSVVSTLKFMEMIAWIDKGNYTCVSENGVPGRSAVTWSAVHVTHGPIILNERYPTDGLAAADVGATARISCKVSARPEPKFVWMRNASELRDGETRYAIRSTRIANAMDEFESVLEISDSVESDHGPYLCRATNGQGARKEIIIKLQPKTKPQLPRGVRTISFAPNWLLVGWRPGFNGGSDQKFQFEYRKVNPWKGSPDGTEPITFNIDTRNASTIIIYGGEDAEEDFTTLMVFNMSNLIPLSSYWFRLRAVNPLGESEWTPVTTAATSDVYETTEIPRPHSLIYNFDEKRIEFEPAGSNQNLLLLLLISTKFDQSKKGVDNIDLWRAVGYFAEGPINNIESAEHFKARFCYNHNMSMCSGSSDILVASALMSSTWKYAVPGGIVAVLLLLAVLLFIMCCRMRRSASVKSSAGKKSAVADERRPEVSAPLPQSETKNTIVHGSQADSGIFTLGSLPNSAQPVKQPTATNTPAYNANCEAPADNWGGSDDAYDFSNDPYLQEYSSQFMPGTESFPCPPSLNNNPNYNLFYDGFNGREGQPLSENRGSTEAPPTTIYEDQEDSDEASYTANGGRRVMREIIV